MAVVPVLLGLASAWNVSATEPGDPIARRLQDADEAAFLALAATCDDITRRRQVDRLFRDISDARKVYERQTAQSVDLSMILIEGDGCVGSEHFQRNLRAGRRALADVREVLK